MPHIASLGDSKVYTAQGPKRIDEVEKGEMVWSWNGDRELVLSEVSEAGCSGEDEILTIKTTNRTVRTNRNHRFLVRRKHPAPREGAGGYQCIEWKNEWVVAGDLSVGDTLITLDSIPEQNLTEINGRQLTEGFMEFCGLLIGDGNVLNAGVTIARANDAPYMDHYRQVMREEFISYSNFHHKKREQVTSPVHLYEGERQTRFASVLTSRELRELGFSGNAHTKSIPGWIFQTPRSLRLAFLRGFLDADGSIDKKGRASFASVNQDMLEQIRHLCMSVGVPVTNLLTSERLATLPQGHQMTYTLSTFTCSDPGSNCDIWSHNPIYQQRLKDGQPFNRKERAYPHYGGKDFDIQGCSLARISSIELGEVEPVYDLTVAETHSFISDGIVVHNSNIEDQDLSYLKYTVRPWLRRWQQALMRDVMTLLEDGPTADWLIEFDTSMITEADMKTRNESFATGIQNGYFSINDVRKKMNMNPIEFGDIHLAPLNMIPIDRLPDFPFNGQPDEPKNPGTPNSGGDSANEASTQLDTLRRTFVQVLREPFRRLITKEQRSVANAKKKDISATDWAEEFYPKHRSLVFDTLEDATTAYISYCSVLDETVVFDEERLRPILESVIDQYIERRKRQMEHLVIDYDYPAEVFLRSILDEYRKTIASN